MFIITHCLHKFKFYKTSCYHTCIIISINNFLRQSFLLYKIFTHDCIAIDKICISDDNIFDEFSIPDAIKISDLCQWLRRQKVQQHSELLGAGVISVRQVILNRNMFTGELVTSWVSWQTHLDIKLNCWKLCQCVAPAMIGWWLKWDRSCSLFTRVCCTRQSEESHWVSQYWCL